MCMIPPRSLKDFTIAKVIEAKPHPNADRLRVCMVDTGSGAPVQVVCGAPNARTGMKSVFSAPGTYIPGKKITLGKGVIRGVESLGMLCSSAELELSNDHEGIIDLPEDAPVGAVYAQWAGLDDPIIDINLTPNRPDAAGVHGIARDLAAAGLGVLKSKDILPVEGKFPCPVRVTLDFKEEDQHLAPFFGLRLVRGVNNGSSPHWLQARLREIGLRPINALVDITNFLTFDRARPLHVFDAKKVKGDLVVRRAKMGETLLALDGRTYELDESMVVICDDNGPESLAGVMGGEASGCDESTTDVLIETALWDPMNIAHTGRKLGIVTDARYRFERGVDPAFALPGIELATQLVLEFCGGEPSELALAGELPRLSRAINFPWSETKRLTGLDAPREEAAAILERLGFSVESAGADIAHIAAPSWRPDIEGKADIVEEVVRMIGVDNVPSTPLPRADGRRAARADDDAETRPQRPPRARRPGPCRGGDLVLRLEGASGSVRRRQAGAGARQSHCFGTFRHAAEPVARTSWRRRAATPRAGLAIRTCSRSARYSSTPRRPANESPRRASGADSPARGATGRRRRVKRAPSTPGATSWRCSTRSASRPAACRSYPAVRNGFIPAARRPCNSGQRRLSAISANCIRAR